MATLRLDIIVIPTFDELTLAVADASTYPTTPIVQSPNLEITVPGLGTYNVPFTINTLNVLNSESIGFTASGDPLMPLPDGVYYIKYSISPAYVNHVDKSIIRVDRLQEKFDKAFMKLDMMECDRAIKTQQKVDLNSIYFFIQGAIAAANNCAADEAIKLYNQADKMLNNFMRNGCQCSGINYVTNFY
jgi:hypothetical protein